MRLFPRHLSGIQKHCKRSRGRPATTFIDQLEPESGLSRQDLASIMANRWEWDSIIKSGGCARNRQIDSHKVVLGPTKYVFLFQGVWFWVLLTKTSQLRTLPKWIFQNRQLVYHSELQKKLALVQLPQVNPCLKNNQRVPRQR